MQCAEELQDIYQQLKDLGNPQLTCCDHEETKIECSALEEQVRRFQGLYIVTVHSNCMAKLQIILTLGNKLTRRSREVAYHCRIHSSPTPRIGILHNT